MHILTWVRARYWRVLQGGRGTVIATRRLTGDVGVLFLSGGLRAVARQSDHLFLGNDLGFWGAHQELAKRLAASNYNVVGFDVKKYFNRLPDDTLRRGKAFADSVAIILKRVRVELGADTMPMIAGGHLIGAEVATYIASRAAVAHFKGVLLISPGARGHLRIAAADLAMSGEPTEPGSFSVAENVRAIPAQVRIAIVRGTDDRYRTADSALLVAGSGRIEKWWVP